REGGDWDRDRRARDERGQQCERGRRILGLDAPPDCMPAGEAGRCGRPVAERARETEPGRERGRTIAGVVPVLKEKGCHEASVPAHGPWIIGGAPLTASLKRGRVTEDAPRPQGWTHRRA